jgi:hypothetical protein
MTATMLGINSKARHMKASGLNDPAKLPGSVGMKSSPVDDTRY